MAEREFGPPCPGCTPAIITARIERFPGVYAACVACLDRGALAHAFGLVRRDDAEEECHAQG